MITAKWDPRPGRPTSARAACSGRTAAVSACLFECARLGVIAFVGTLLRVRTTVFRSCGTPPRTGRFAGTDETLLVHGLVPSRRVARGDPMEDRFNPLLPVGTNVPLPHPPSRLYKLILARYDYMPSTVPCLRVTYEALRRHHDVWAIAHDRPPLHT